MTVWQLIFLLLLLWLFGNINCHYFVADFNFIFAIFSSSSDINSIRCGLSQQKKFITRLRPTISKMAKRFRKLFHLDALWLWKHLCAIFILAVHVIIRNFNSFQLNFWSCQGMGGENEIPQWFFREREKDRTTECVMHRNHIHAQHSISFRFWFKIVREKSTDNSAAIQMCLCVSG